MSVSLMSVLEKIGEIAKARGESFYSVRAVIEHSRSGIETSYESYVHPGILVKGSTPEELLTNLKVHIGLIPALPQEDILIDLP